MHGTWMFDFLRNCQTIFHINCIVLHSPEPCIRVTVSHFKTSSHPHWYEVVLIRISMVTDAVEHGFMSFLAICMTALV
jgi:hypothetical protein